jgi:hypothetical protein
MVSPSHVNTSVFYDRRRLARRHVQRRLGVGSDEANGIRKVRKTTARASEERGVDIRGKKKNRSQVSGK